MILRSNDNLFNAYNNKYIYLEVNGEIGKYLVNRTTPNTSFDTTTVLDPINDTYSVISEASEQSCP